MTAYRSGLDLMINELKELNGYDFEAPKTIKEKEDILRRLMTVSKPGVLSSSYYEAEKAFIKAQNKNKKLLDVYDIEERIGQAVYLHKGDITTLKADAIVNACNEKLLGCFVPGHHCIDNAIHLSAGLGLRNACNELMQAQGFDEPVGRAKVTEGYNLPSKYVVHTVGPNVNGPIQLTNDELIGQLKSCYTSSLESVRSYEDVKTLVFCSISTGIYGVPIELASKVAVKVILDYLKDQDHHLERVIIDVFSEEDYDVYKKCAQEIR